MFAVSRRSLFICWKCSLFCPLYTVYTEQCPAGSLHARDQHKTTVLYNCYSHWWWANKPRNM